MPSQLQLPTDVPRLATYPWHPKLTASRLLVISSTVGLGIAKATAAHRGETIAPVTIEWITTTLVFLIYLVLSVVELNHRPRPAWLFQRDTLDIVWMFAKKLSFRPPVYETEETTAELLVKPRHPPITLYRLLVTFTALGFGLLKAAFSYLGKTTEPTTLDWFLGVVVTTGLYYLGLYERSSRRVLSSIFEQDYREEFLHAGSFVVWTANYTMGLLLSFGWIYLWSLTFYEGILGEHSSHKTNDLINDFFAHVVTMLWLPCVAILPIGAGLVAVFVFISLLGRLVGLPVLTLLLFAHSRLWRRSKPPSSWTDQVNNSQHLLDEVGLLFLRLRSTRSFRRVRFVLVYVVAHVAVIACSLGWTAMGAILFGLFTTPVQAQRNPWYMLGPSAIPVCMGAIIVLTGICTVLFTLYAFFSIFVRRQHITITSWSR